MAFNLRQAAVATAFAVASLGAQAESHSISLNGVLGNASSFSFDSGSIHFDNWQLNLQGLDSDAPLTLSQGDTLRALITFDGPLTVPASVTLTYFTFALTGTGFVGDVQTDGQYELKLNSVSVLAKPSNCGTATQMANCWVLFPPNNGAITFDEVVVDFTVTALSAPVSIDGAEFSYSLFSPVAAVPEPMSAGLLLAGLAGLAWMRRRPS